MYESRCFKTIDAPSDNNQVYDRTDIYVIFNDPNADSIGIKFRDVSVDSNQLFCELFCELEVKHREKICDNTGSEQWIKVLTQKVQITFGDTEQVLRILKENGLEFNLPLGEAIWIIVDKCIQKSYTFTLRCINETSILRIHIYNNNNNNNNQETNPQYFQSLSHEADYPTTPPLKEHPVQGYPAFLRTKILNK
jgi:hypothetical protein